MLLILTASVQVYTMGERNSMHKDTNCGTHVWVLYNKRMEQVTHECSVCERGRSSHCDRRHIEAGRQVCSESYRYWNDLNRNTNLGSATCLGLPLSSQ